MAIENYSTTAADNTSLNGETVSDATLGSKLDNLFRELMADLATYFPSGVLAILRGGTGASTASGARTNLGLVIGTHVQAQNANLETLAGLSSGATSNLETLAGITPGATGQALLADATAADARAELELGNAATLNAGTGANELVQRDGSGNIPSGSTSYNSVDADEGVAFNQGSQTYTFTHGLGAVPVNFSVLAECTSPDGAYEVGEFIGLGDGSVVSGNNYLMTPKLTSTQVVVRQSGSVRAIGDNGNSFTLGNGDWDIHIYASIGT